MLPLFLALTVLCIAISIIKNRKELSRLKVVETILFYILFINVGLSGLLAFYGHAFMADKVAATIGWAPGSPFQFEVAVANLAFGVLGVLCIRFRDGFWLATGIGYAIFLSERRTATSEKSLQREIMPSTMPGRYYTSATSECPH